MSKKCICKKSIININIKLKLNQITQFEKVTFDFINKLRSLHSEDKPFVKPVSMINTKIKTNI